MNILTLKMAKERPKIIKKIITWSIIENIFNLKGDIFRIYILLM